MNLYEEANKPKFPTEYIKSNLKSSNDEDNEIINQNNKIREENKFNSIRDLLFGRN